MDFDRDPAPPAPPPPIAHYYGDIVRQLFIATAVLMLVAAPFYADSLRKELPFEVVGAIVLIALAALANPHQRFVMTTSAIVSGAGALIYQVWALFSYNESTVIQFLLREAVALLFLAGFYFSMKTVRAFVLGKVGKHDEAGEFDE